MCMCVCVCVCVGASIAHGQDAHTDRPHHRDSSTSSSLSSDPIAFEDDVTASGHVCDVIRQTNDDGDDGNDDDSRIVHVLLRMYGRESPPPPPPPLSPASCGASSSFRRDCSSGRTGRRRSCRGRCQSSTMSHRSPRRTGRNPECTRHRRLRREGAPCRSHARH